MFDACAACAEYDPNGNLLTAIDRKGQAVSYAYDALNRLAKATYVDATVSYGWVTGTVTGLRGLRGRHTQLTYLDAIASGAGDDDAGQAGYAGTSVALAWDR